MTSSVSKLSLVSSVVLTIAGCATNGSENGAPLTGAPSTRVSRSAPTHQSVRALQNCLTNAIRASRATNLTVMIGAVESEATGGQYAKGLPQPVFSTFVTSVTREMGFTPYQLETDLLGQRTAVKNKLQPDLVVRGGVTGFDALVSRERSARDGGISVGGGHGMATASGSSEDAVSLGTVTATINIESPARRGNEGVIWYPVTATGNSTAEFRMTQSTKQASASILVGIGGGFARESVNVVDVQSAAMFALRMATILAIADQLKVNSPVCHI